MNLSRTPPKQRGATLLISLVLLLVLTILALAAGRSATLQQRMAGNMQQQDLAFQYAENGIQAAILELEDESIRPQQGERCLFSLEGTAPASDWIDCSKTTTNNNGYRVKVEKVDCAGGSMTGTGSAGSIGDSINLTGGTCYRITSNGRYQEATAVHLQGYMF